MNSYKFLLLFVLISVGLVGCSKDDDTNNPQSQTAQMTVKLIDAPGDYEAVFVDVVDVMVKISSNDPESETTGEWQSLGNIDAGVYDLLSLTNGVSQLLADAEVQPGHLTDMRLVLGTNNTIVIEGTPYPLTTPSAQQSGLKLKVDHELVAGEEYNFVLDFNVDESIVVAGESGQYILKPVMRLFLEAKTGEISGSVSPAEVQTKITAATGDEIVATTYTDEEGGFVLQGLPTGTYTVVLTPDMDSGHATVTYNNIAVEAGTTTEMDPVTLP